MTKRSFLFRSMGKNKHLQTGVSMTETLLLVPVIFLLFGAIMHVSMVAQAKSNLEYAALMAARVASTTPNFGLVDDAVKNEVMKRMRASDPNNATYESLCTSKGINDFVIIKVLSPNYQAFIDFGRPDIVLGSTAIPNDNLSARSQQLSGDGISIQDANILHMRVFYLYDSRIPFMSIPAFLKSPTGVVDPTLPGHIEGCLDDPWSEGTWISADAVVVMQTPALMNNITDPHIVGSPSYVSPPY